MGLSQADDVSSPDASPNPDQPCSPALGRRSRASSASDVCSHGSSRRIPSGSQNLAGIKQPTSPPGPSRLATGKEEPVDAGTCTSPPFSSPSIPSSIAYSNPGLSTSLLRRELSRTTPPRNADAVTSRAVRYDLARRLSQLARRLTYDGSDSNMDEIVLGNQLEELEKAVGRGGSGPEEAQKLPGEAAMLDGAARRSNGSSAIASSASSMLRSRFSDLSASLHREREAAALADAPRGIEEELSPKKGMSARQAKKVIAEMSKLNDELTSVVSNLKARQEESEHIQGLLIERAERAAQRIIFLQSRIAHLEQELEENDDELQHLRICLKAVEIQMPPHPDKELQRCIAAFKDDYQALKHKRAHRATITSATGFDSSSESPGMGSPTQ